MKNRPLLSLLLTIVTIAFAPNPAAIAAAPAQPTARSWPHYIGTDQSRNFRFEGDRLILSDEETPPGGERRRYQMAWQRVSAGRH